MPPRRSSPSGAEQSPPEVVPEVGGVSGRGHAPGTHSSLEVGSVSLVSRLGAGRAIKS